MNLAATRIKSPDLLELRAGYRRAVRDNKFAGTPRDYVRSLHDPNWQPTAEELARRAALAARSDEFHRGLQTPNQSASASTAAPTEKDPPAMPRHHNAPQSSVRSTLRAASRFLAETRRAVGLWIAGLPSETGSPVADPASCPQAHPQLPASPSADSSSL